MKRGELTQADHLILEHLAAVGSSTTKELTEDLEDVGRAAYARLRRLHRLGHVGRYQIGNSTTLLWFRR